MRRLALLLLLAAVGCRTTSTLDHALRSTPEAEATDASDARARLSTVAKTVDGARYALMAGLITSLYAKEVCSCYFISKIDKKTCEDRASMYITSALVKVEIEDEAPGKLGVVRAVGRKDKEEGVLRELFAGEGERIINPPFEAEFRSDAPHLGCRITTVPRIPYSGEIPGFRPLAQGNGDAS